MSDLLSRILLGVSSNQQRKLFTSKPTRSLQYAFNALIPSNRPKKEKYRPGKSIYPDLVSGNFAVDRVFRLFPTIWNDRNMR